MNEEDQEFFDGLKNNDERTIKKYFQKYAPSCISFSMARHGCSQIRARYAYVYAFEETHHNVRKGALKEFRESALSYIKTVASNFLNREATQQIKHSSSLKEYWRNQQFRNDTGEEREEKMRKAEELRKALDILGERCTQLLMAKKGYNVPIDVLMEDFGYASKSATTNAISNCFKRLKKLLLNNSLKN